MLPAADELVLGVDGRLIAEPRTVAQPEANPEISTLLFNISVTNRDHMARVLRKLRRNPKVVRVHRVV